MLWDTTYVSTVSSTLGMHCNVATVDVGVEKRG